MHNGLFHDFISWEYVGVKDFFDPYGAKARRRLDESKPPPTPLAARLGLGTLYITGGGNKTKSGGVPKKIDIILDFMDRWDNVDLLSPGNID